MASSAAADPIPALVGFDRLHQTLGPELRRDPSPGSGVAPESDMPTLWTRWAHSLPVLPLDACEVEVESDLSFVRFSLSGRF